MDTYKNYINGKWKSGNADLIYLHNPADINNVIGQVSYADNNLVDQAIETSIKAWEAWRSTPVSKRVKILKSALEMIQSAKEDVASKITMENGKTLNESYAEVNAAITEGNFQLDFITNNLSETVGDHEIWHEALGTVLLITPSNFPLAAVIRKLIPALACGNTAILKPSEFTPITSTLLFSFLEQAGLPKGVANLVLGLGADLAPHLLAGDIKAISVTGSTQTGKAIAKSICERDIRFQAEMGGKNAVAVLKDADIPSAVEAIFNSAFACAGQWCTGTSRVIVEQPVYDKLISSLLDKTKKIVVGNGLQKSTTMGPLVSQQQLLKVIDAVKRAIQDGADLLHGGEPPAGLAEGYYFQPTILGAVTPNMQLAQKEIFGPVLAILKGNDFNHIIELINASQYGLTSSLYTKDKRLADLYVQKVETGLCHVNLATSYRDPAMPLTCWKNSGRGLPEAGRYARDFYTKPKAIYRND